MEIQEQIKTTRVKIDAIAQLVDTKDLKSAETVKCHNELLMAKCFLGKILGELGSATPYGNDGNRKSVADIEPTADRANPEEVEQWPKKPESWKEENGIISVSRVEKVDYLRECIGAVLKELTDSKILQEDGPIFLSNATADLSVWNKLKWFTAEVYTSLCKARFWLGFELERIRETDKSSTL